MTPPRPARSLVPCLALVAILWAALPAAAQAPLAPEAQRAFLLTANVVASRPIGRGVTGSTRLTLSDGIVTHDAAFQTIDTRPSIADRRQGVTRAGEMNFVDSYKFNLAAYAIASLLGVETMMPVTVEREWEGRTGSLTWWVDDVLMDEGERDKNDVQPPPEAGVHRQRMLMTTFAELIGDVDRNQGNILYTTDWRVIMIDFTRAFRGHRAPRQPDVLTRVDRRFWERLQALTGDDLRAAAGRYLTTLELRAVMYRRDALVERFARLIRERGEAAVVY